MNKEAITRHPISEAARKRWSPRAFKDQPVEKEKLIGLLEILNPIRKTEAKGACRYAAEKTSKILSSAGNSEIHRNWWWSEMSF